MFHRIYPNLQVQCGHCYWVMSSIVKIGEPATAECLNENCPHFEIKYLLPFVEVYQNVPQKLSTERTDRGITTDSERPGELGNDQARPSTGVSLSEGPPKRN